VLKWFALWVPIPWRGYKVIPELDQQIGGTSPVEFKADVRARLFVMLLLCLPLLVKWAHVVLYIQCHASAQLPCFIPAMHPEVHEAC
jgi:hypothetical protein